MEVSPVFFHSWGGWARDTRFSNNIFYYAGGSAPWRFGESAGNVFRHNVFYGDHQDLPPDEHAITSDPMLVAPGSGREGMDSLAGYQLRAGSFCLGAGAVIPDNGGRDFWGNPVPRDRPPDIGAHQREQPAR
jgi:hypothetical protein